jgi:hypothetical protein
VDGRHTRLGDRPDRDLPGRSRPASHSWTRSAASPTPATIIPRSTCVTQV